MDLNSVGVQSTKESLAIMTRSLLVLIFLSSGSLALGEERTSIEGLTDIVDFPTNHQSALDFIFGRNHHGSYLFYFFDNFQWSTKKESLSFCGILTSPFLQIYMKNQKKLFLQKEVSSADIAYF